MSLHRYVYHSLGRLCRNDIEAAKASLPKADLEDLEMKLVEIKGTVKFSDFRDEIIFEKAFVMGYVATYIKEHE